MGWAAQTIANTCYEKDGRPRRYPALCERKYWWGQVKEDYVLPEAHTVALWLAPDVVADPTAECVWTWQPRRPNGKTDTRRMPCKQRLTIARVPYAIERAHSGVSVSVKLPDGRELTEPELVVEDLFIVALGDSFASGESNPDQPVQFSASREMVYDPTLAQSYGVARMEPKQTSPGYGLASSSDQSNPKVLPRRYMEDEAADRYYPLGSREFVAAFEKANARWLSRDCHRSQYGYPLRVAMQLALENRHRAVTFATFACSGAEIHHGLFGEMDAREGAREVPRGKVAAQLDQLSDICRGAHSQTGAYTLPAYAHGGTAVTEQKIAKSWCPPQLRKRGIDLVLLSIGGDDVGFSALAAFSLTEQVSDLAPIAGLVGSSIRFGPQVAQVYLDVLDRRMKALKDALHDGFGVAPGARRAVFLRAHTVRRGGRGVRTGSNARHGCASRTAAGPPAVGRDGAVPRPFLETPRMYRQYKAACRLSRAPCDGQRHRLCPGDGAHPRIQQARPLRARSRPCDDRRIAHARAAQARQRG
jgi:hypothetical protein